MRERVHLPQTKASRVRKPREPIRHASRDRGYLNIDLRYEISHEVLMKYPTQYKYCIKMYHSRDIK